MKKAYAAMFALGLVAALVIVNIVSAPDPPPYEYVDQAVQRPDASEERRVKLHGFAAAVERQGNRWDFALERNGRSVRASFAGLAPDGFTDGSEVIVTGLLIGNSELRATGLAIRRKPLGS